MEWAADPGPGVEAAALVSRRRRISHIYCGPTTATPAAQAHVAKLISTVIAFKEDNLRMTRSPPASPITAAASHSTARLDTPALAAPRSPPTKATSPATAAAIATGRAWRAPSSTRSSAPPPPRQEPALSLGSTGYTRSPPRCPAPRHSRPHSS